MKKMFVLGQNPTLIVLLISALILLGIENADGQGDPISESNQFPCFSSENYTANSPFETNLNILLSSLVSNGSGDGFFNTSVGVNPDIVYGLVQCRGDISQDLCRSCLYNSSVELIKKCPNRRVATLRYDHCILRYSNVRFFSQVDTASRNEYNPRPVSDADAASFIEQLRSLFTKVSMLAVSRPNRFAYGNADYSPSGKRVYGLVQCNEVLLPSSCTSCLQSLVSNIPACCDKRVGAKIFSATCYLRYEQENFSVGLSPPIAVTEGNTAL